MLDGENSIEFVCTVYKVQTLVDGGLRVSLDLPEGLIIEAGALIKCFQDHVALRVVATPESDLLSGL
jgi:hypothetical protein